MPQIAITPAKLTELRMMTDGQLVDLGIDPASVTSAWDVCQEEIEAKIKSGEFHQGCRRCGAGPDDGCECPPPPMFFPSCT